MSSTASFGRALLCGLTVLIQFFMPIVARCEETWMRRFSSDKTEVLLAAVGAEEQGWLAVGYSVSKLADKRDGWAVKFSRNGSVEWERTYGGGGNVDLNAVSLGADKGFLLAGTMGRAGYLAKVDPGGNLLWSHSYQQGDETAITSMIATGDGGHVLAGVVAHYAPAGSSSSTHRAFWVCKISADGTVIWEKTFDGFEFGPKVLAHADGSYSVAAGSRAFHLDRMGNVLWGRTFGAAISGIALSKEDGLVLSGTTDVRPLESRRARANYLGSRHAWMAKLTRSGAEEWQHLYHGLASDYAQIATSDANGFMLSGWTQSYGAGDSDAWLVKLSSDGAVEWQRTFGTSGIEEGISLVGDPRRGYLLLGRVRDKAWHAWVLKTDGAGMLGKCPEGFCGVSHARTSVVKVPSRPDAPTAQEATSQVAVPDVIVQTHLHTMWDDSLQVPVSLDPGMEDFGMVIVGEESARQVFSIINRANFPVTAGKAFAEGKDAGSFHIIEDICSGLALDPASTCKIGIVFAPDKTGSKMATLLVPLSESRDRGAPAPIEAKLSGIGSLKEYPSVALLSPNGGEKIMAESPFTIQWGAPKNAEVFDLALTPDGKVVAKGLTGHSYSWVVPADMAGPVGRQVRVTAYDTQGSRIGEARSNNLFVVLPAYPRRSAIWTDVAEVGFKERWLSVNASGADLRYLVNLVGLVTGRAVEFDADVSGKVTTSFSDLNPRGGIARIVRASGWKGGVTYFENDGSIAFRSRPVADGSSLGGMTPNPQERESVSEELLRRTGIRWKLEWDGVSNQLRRLSGQPPRSVSISNARDLELWARRLLEGDSVLLGIDPTQLGSFTVSETGGRITGTFLQEIDGVPVEGGSITIAVTRGETSIDVNLHFFSSLSVPPPPYLTVRAAEDLAELEYRRTFKGCMWGDKIRSFDDLPDDDRLLYDDTSQLIVPVGIPEKRPTRYVAHLAYSVRFLPMGFLVDANTGEILQTSCYVAY